MPKQAVLLLAHGTPETVEQIPEYLSKVTGGRPLPLEVVEERNRGRNLLVHLGGECDREDHVADAAMPADRVVDHEQDGCDVAAGEDELARGPEGGGLDLGPPQPPSGSLPQLGMAPLDLVLQTEDTQLLGRAGGGRQP